MRMWAPCSNVIRNFKGLPWWSSGYLQLCASTARSPGSTPGQRTEIPHAVQCGWGWKGRVGSNSRSDGRLLSQAQSPSELEVLSDCAGYTSKKLALLSHILKLTCKYIYITLSSCKRCDFSILNTCFKNIFFLGFPWWSSG